MRLTVRIALGLVVLLGVLAPVPGSRAQESAPPSTTTPQGKVPAAERSAEPESSRESSASPSAAPPPATEPKPDAAPRTRSPRRFTPSEEVSPDNDVPFPVDI